MRKFITAVALCCLAGTAALAQDLLNQVPSTAAMVIKYSGENFSRNMPIKKLDSYRFIKDDFFKTLNIDTLTSLQNVGINFEQDIYQYLTMEDSSMSFVTLLHLKNEAQFLKLIKANYSATKKTIKKKDFKFLPVSATSYIGWNKTMAIIVNTTYQNRKSYYDYSYGSNTDSAVSVATTDTVISVEEIQEEKVEVIPDSSANYYDSIEVVPMDEEESDSAKLARQIADSLSNLKWELWQQQQDMIAKKQQEQVAEKIMTAGFLQKVYSIKNDKSYNRIIDRASHASVWFNTESILMQYWNYFYRGTYNMLDNSSSYHTDTTDGLKSSVNLYFEKDRLRMESRSFSADPKTEQLTQSVLNSRQSQSLINYVNPGNIGYFSMSINTEAMANYYYSYLKKYMSNQSYMREYADIFNLYIDLLEIIIDEKAIADLLPGNYLFIMHDMKPQIVNYTDYEYDEEFNRKEVKKTKKELSPDFSFVFETKKEGFLEKCAKLPLKYAEKEGYDYKQKDGYYQLSFKEGDYPISSLYFMIKDGKVIITTSKATIDMTVNNTAFPVDESTRNSILNNNYSLHLNSKKLVEKLDTQVNSDVNKKITEYLQKNIGDIKMESGIKDGMIQGTTIMHITGNNSNSLEFFFNMMEAINNIYEQDKQEKEKKLY